MNLRLRKTLALMLAFVMVFALLPAQVAYAESKELIILHTNDIHGNAVGDKDAEKGSLIGLAKYKAYIDGVKAKNPNVLVLDAGDYLHGTTFATISRGESMLELANLIGFDAFAPGNHDFNYGYQRLKELAGKANFPVLAANVVDSSTKANVFDKTTIVEVGGIKVGIFGLATPETKTKSNPLNTQGIEFTDPIVAAKEMVADLNGKADLIVCLSHIGLDEESDTTSEDLAKQIPEIDIIIDGHSHTALDTGKKVGTTLIAQTGGHLKQIGEVTVKIDGSTIESSAKLIPFKEAFTLEPDAAVLAKITEVEEANKPFLEKVVGKTKTELVGIREKVRAGETNLGQLLADSMIEETKADVAITNGGGIRASIDAGDITRGEILTSFPFTNYPVVLEISGSALKAALEYGVSEYPNAAGKFPHVAGMTFTVQTGDGGNKVTDLKVNGVDVDLEKNYKLVTNDFLAVGGDGYDMFKGAKKLSEHILLSEVLENYIAKLTAEAGEIDYTKDPRIKYTEVELGQPKRIFGDTRYQTAVEVSKELFQKADTVIVANGMKYPDSLAAGPLATLENAPILLTAEKDLHASTLGEIERLGAKNAIIVGGERSVGEEVFKALEEKGLKVTRLFGQNRYETAIEIAAQVLAKNKTDKVVMASGEGFADALSVSSLASVGKEPILLTPGANILDGIKTALEKWEIKAVTIAGGESTIKPGVELVLKDMEIKVTRLAGANRYATAVEIAKVAYPEATVAVAADGTGFADALSVVPYAYSKKAPLVMVAPKELPADTEAYLKGSKIEELVIVGGENSVCEGVAKLLQKAIKAE